jgi:hypothetical protein
MRALLWVALWLAAVPVAVAEVYKWKDEHGVTHYGDKPGGAGAKPVDLPALQYYGDLKKGASAAAKSFKGPTPYGGSGPRIEITQPMPDSTLPAGKFTVMVAANLASGQNLNYYLDGELQNPIPTVSTAFLFAGAEKGDHMISAAVVDSSGREVSRSEPVIVHLQPTAAASAAPKSPAP